MSGSRWVITPLWLSGLKIFFVQFFHVFLPPFLNIFCFCYIPTILSFIVLIFAWNIPLASLIFLKRLLVFPILLFSSVSLHWSLRKAFLSLLAILWNSVFRCLFLSFPSLHLASLLSYLQGLLRHLFCFLHFFPLGMVLIPVSSTMSRTSVHSSSGTLSDLGPYIYFFALIAEEGFLISPCYSLELCIQMDVSFLFSFAFRFSIRSSPLNIILTSSV